MSDFKIIGSPNPEIGKESQYSVSHLNLNPFSTEKSLEKNPFEEQIKWSVYILEYGKWILKEKNNKTGPTATYTFTEISMTRKGIRIVAQLGEEKATLDIKPIHTIERKIIKVELCDALGNLQTKPFGYNQTVIARVHCLNLNNCTVHVTLWEDDAPGAGHSEINKNNKAITKSELVSNGIANVKFRLAPDFAKMANAQLAKGDKSEEKTHEYYVTAEVFRQKTVSSNNINVSNPDYKTTDSKSIPQKPEQKPVKPKSAGPAETKGKSKKQEKGIKEPVSGTIYDWSESILKAIPIILPDPIEVINSLAKIFMPNAEEEKKDEKEKCPRCNQDFKYDDIVKIFPSASKNKNLATKLIEEINLLKNKYKINTCLRKAHLINQLGSETGFNTLIEEIDGYSTTTLTNLFGYFKRHPKEAEIYKGNLYEIAIRAYGLRKVDNDEDIVSCVLSPGGKCNDLGNESKEEGYTYIGRGLIQLTGKYNYSQINKDFKKAFPEKGDLVKNPQLLEEPKYAVMSAFSYWINNNLNSKADLGSNPANVDSITKIINKNLDASHYEKRRKSFLTSKEVYRLNECKNIDQELNAGVVIRLIRKWQTKKSTIGEFTIDNSDITGYILEEKGPDTTISGIEQRIPTGTYNLVWHNGTKFKNVLKLYNNEVSINRAILIHAGNSAESTEGCLLPGSSRSVDWVSKSVDKLNEINEYVKSIGIENAKIIITQEYE